MSRISSNSWLGFVISPPRFCKVLFTLSQQYSMMFMSGDWGGHTMPWMLFSYLYLSTIRTRWTGASIVILELVQVIGKVTANNWPYLVILYLNITLLYLYYIYFTKSTWTMQHDAKLYTSPYHNRNFGFKLHDSADILSGRYAPWADLQTYIHDYFNSWQSGTHH